MTWSASPPEIPPGHGPWSIAPVSWDRPAAGLTERAVSVAPVAPVAPPSAGPPGRATPTRRRITGRGIAASVCALALLGGATAAVVGYLSTAGPATVVTTYFRALQDRDASRALGQGDLPAGDRRFLTSEVLRQQQQIARIDSVEVTASVRRGTSATVAVAYTLGDGASRRQQQSILSLHERSRHWRMDAVVSSVTVRLGAAAHRATLAGGAIPLTAVLLFPGAAPVGYDTDRLEPDPTSAIVDLGTSGPVNLTTRISDRGATAATEAATSAMRRCLSAPTVDPGCPLDPAGSRSVPGTLRGTVTSTSVSQPPALVDDDRDGLVEVQGRFTVLGSWLTLDFDNIAARRSGSTSVSFRLRVYVTGATAVSWMGP